MTPSQRRPKALVTVRRSILQDAAAMARMMGDPAVLGNLMQMPHTSEELWRARLTDNATPGKLDLPLVAEVNGEVVGSAGLHPVSPAARRRHAVMLGISVMSTAQGQGVGTALMAALCDYADNWLGVLRMELDVYADNTIAIALYKKFGFELEGTHRAYSMRNGEYVDSLSMARFHPKQPLVPAGVAPCL